MFNNFLRHEDNWRDLESQLRFALSSCGAWRIVDDEFDHRQFYIYIIDYFEHPPTSAAKASIDTLLVWWNRWVCCKLSVVRTFLTLCRKVFGARNVSTYLPQNVAQYSVANTSARRCQWYVLLMHVLPICIIYVHNNLHCGISIMDAQLF